jgi:hypothetical protein
MTAKKSPNKKSKKSTNKPNIKKKQPKEE